jgi:TPR repeat protein
MKINKKLTSMFLAMSITFAAGNAAADFKDGLYFYYKGDLKEAFVEWEGLAKKGDADSQYNLGIMYHHGEAVLKNNIKARHWLEAASQQGHKKADEELGHLYCIMNKRKVLGIVAGMQSVFCK